VTAALADAPVEGISDAEFAAIRDLVLRSAGIALSPAKRQLVCSRLAKRLRALELPSYGDYFRHVTQRDPRGEEMQRLINCITTNKTDFFREPHHFEFLGRSVFAARAGERPVTIWSAGCSTGEEPYSIAMLAREQFGERARAAVEVFATDIDTDVLRHASAAVYDDARVADLRPEQVRRHFVHGAQGGHGRVQVRPEVRALVRFGQVNLTAPPWSVPRGLDVIFCRNVIIYFNRETQERLMRGFAEQLRPGGHLILGHSENLHWLSDLFEPIGQTVYRVRAGAARARSLPPAPSRSLPLERPRPAPNPAARLMAGDVKAGGGPLVLKTLLGSCVAACLFDPVAGVGGMNHFLLPSGTEAGPLSNRFGVHAMEMLINEVVRLGGDRRRLRAKAFGGANVVAALRQRPSVSERNAAFIREFLETEQIPLVAQKLGGTRPLEVIFQPATGRARVRELAASVAERVEVEAERHHATAYRRVINPPGGGITLFEEDSK
jgi:chemotaxis protein methyltransferase CheR